MNDIQTLANIAGMTAELIDSGKLVSVVRCKDCKNYGHGDWYKESGECMIKAGYFPVTSDWFCADGERRTDDA